MEVLTYFETLEVFLLPNFLRFLIRRRRWNKFSTKIPYILRKFWKESYFQALFEINVRSGILFKFLLNYFYGSIKIIPCMNWSFSEWLAVYPIRKLDSWVRLMWFAAGFLRITQAHFTGKLYLPRYFQNSPYGTDPQFFN